MTAHASNESFLQDLTEMSGKIWLHHAVATAVNLGIFDALADKPIGCDALASKLKTNAPTLYRLMRALAVNGFAEEHPEQAFSLTELGRVMRKDHPESMRSVIQLGSLPLMQKAWEHLGDSMRDGRSAFSHAYGKEMYEHLPQDKVTSDIFNASMTAFSRPQVRDVSTQYTDFGRCRNILDVAGGRGHLVAAVLKHFPALHGAVLDLSHLQQPAQALLKEEGVADRAKFVTGNMLESLPSGYDAYMIKNALWNWGDADVTRVLRNMRRALGKEPGRVVVIEQLITKENAHHACLFDLQMLVATHGGRVRTEREFVLFGQEAGLRHNRTLSLGETHLLEFFPA